MLSILQLLICLWIHFNFWHTARSFVHRVKAAASYVSHTFYKGPTSSCNLWQSFHFQILFVKLPHRQSYQACFPVDSTLFGLFLTSVEKDAFTLGYVLEIFCKHLKVAYLELFCVSFLIFMTGRFVEVSALRKKSWMELLSCAPVASFLCCFDCSLIPEYFLINDSNLHLKGW